MAIRSAKMSQDKKAIVIEVELEDPTPSNSGRTLIIGGTHGVGTMGDLKVEGKPVRGNVSLWIKPDKADGE